MRNLRKIIIYTVAIVLAAGVTSALDINSSESLSYFNDGSLEFEVGTAGNIQSYGDLNMNGNLITNFFGSSCASGEAVVDVNDDGSFQCMDISSEVSSDYVSRSGDSMNGNLDMNGNDIVSIGSRGGVDIGDVSGINGVADSNVSGVNVQWDTDFAFFGLRNYGNDRKDVLISNEQTADHIRLQVDGNDRLIARGGGQIDIPSGSLDMNGNNINSINNLNVNGRITASSGIEPIRVGRSSGENSIADNGQSWVGYGGGSSGVLIGYYGSPEVRIGDGSTQVQVRGDLDMDAYSGGFRLPTGSDAW